MAAPEVGRRIRSVKKGLYFFGRALQVAGLLAMPFSIWVGFIGHNEAGSIGIFLGSITVFYAGYLLTRLVTRL